MLGYSLIGRVAANAKRGRGQIAALGLVGATMGIVATPAHAAGPTSPGTSWVVMNAATGQVIAAQHPYTLRYPASLTKLMTLALTFTKLTAGQLNQSTRIPVSLAAADVQPVKLYLRAGQTISIKNAMLGMTTLSANDAATALGQYLGHGSMARFAKIATNQAHALGMLRTRFTNSSGLPDPYQVTDAYDMALLARHILLAYPQYRYLFSVRGFNFRGRWIPNIDGMLTRYPGTIGMKTGFTNLAQFNLVTAARRDGHLLIGVELHARSWNASYDRMAALLNRGFADVTHTLVASNITPRAQASIRAIASHHTAHIREVVAKISDVGTDQKKRVRGWAAQVGSYYNYVDAKRQAEEIHHMRGIGVAYVGSVIVRGHRLWRAELTGLDRAGAQYTCRMMKRYHKSCFMIQPQNQELATGLPPPMPTHAVEIVSHETATSHRSATQIQPNLTVAHGVVPHWIAQVGAYDNYADARRQAQHIRHMRGIGVARVTATAVKGQHLWLAELAGLDHAAARYTCRMMNHYRESCLVLAPAHETLAMR